MIRTVFCWVAIIAVLVCGQTTFAKDFRDCMKCHEEDGEGETPSISLKEYRNSVHGNQFECVDCHTQIDSERHGTIKGDGTVNCGRCHEQENRHGLGLVDADRPKCHTCHSRHGIYGKENAISSVNPRQLRKTCKQCHPVECGEKDLLSRLLSIRIASHSKQDYSARYEEDNCIGCHQGKAAHEETEPISDAQCYKCHLEQGKPQWMGYIHANREMKKQPAYLFSGIAYLSLLVFFLCWGIQFVLRRLIDGQ
jgi:hypothetical protein